MIDWIEAQSPLVIALSVFGLCYALAGAIFGAASMLSRRPIAESLKSISPVTLTPLAMILGLLIAFLAARVWENVARAHEYVGLEAAALSDAVRYADGLPPEVRTKLRSAMKQHVAFIEQQDWPAMARRHAGPHMQSSGLEAAMLEVLSFTSAKPEHELAKQRVGRAIEEAFEARHRRIHLSLVEIAPIQWAVIVLLSTLILVTLAMLHLGRPVAMAATLIIFSTAIGACLVLLFAYDAPLGPGGVTVTPAAYRGIVSD